MADYNFQSSDKEEDAFTLEIDASSSNLESVEDNFTPNKENWLIAKASSIGKSHLKTSINCQDSFYSGKVNESWGIAIVSDGAGSSKRSDEGSKFVAENAFYEFKDLIVENSSKWDCKENLPTQEEWHFLAKKSLEKVYLNLKKNNISTDINELACTIIVLLYSPFSLLVTHIGDGRAGYCNDKDEWLPIITPWKGEEANATVFITSNIWEENKIDKYLSSNVISDSIKIFTLMSDGCEKHCWECSFFDEETQKWSDPNKPFVKFFDVLIKGFNKMVESGLDEISINKEFELFLKEGNTGLSNENDDKTMIIGINSLNN